MTFRVQYLKIQLSSFKEEESHQRFTLNLLGSNFGYYFADNASGTYPRKIRVHYLKILLSIFGEEDFQRFALNFPCSNCFDDYFKDSVGGHHLNKL